MGKYEAEKKKAVESEDFDLAMEKKVCITIFFRCILLFLSYLVAR